MFFTANITYSSTACSNLPSARADGVPTTGRLQSELGIASSGLDFLVLLYQDKRTGTPNGNTTRDEQAGIAYNLLNLPQRIQLTAGRSIENTYAADGRKLYTEAKEGSQLEEGTKYYNGNLVLDKNKELEYIIFPEGRIIKNNTNFVYEYHLRDHLGSIRVAFTPIGFGKQVVQENAYYPFGAPIKEECWGASDNRYKHTGMETVSDFGLAYVDNGARWRPNPFNPPGFMTIDPLAEKYPHISPYAYCNNNPVRYIDPTGMYFDEANEKMAQRLERKLDKQITKLEKDIARIEKKGGDIGDKKDRVGQMRQSKNDIADMRGNQDLEFRYAKTSGDPETTGNSNSNVVTMHVNGDFGIQLHESSHGGQVARGDYFFDSKGNPTLGYHAECEVDAYRSQYSYSGEYRYIHKEAQANTAVAQAYQLLGANAIPPIIINNISLIDAKMVINIGVPYQRGGTNLIKPLYPPNGMTKSRWDGGQ